MKTLSALALCLLLACTSSLHAQSYTALYVFGDSFCDTGNIFIATGGAIPASPYYQGRFSNGPLWDELLGASLGLPVGPVLYGGTNYAFGGAQVLGIGYIPSIPVQVDAYLYLHGGQADPNALYIIEGGVNDIISTNTGSTAQLGYNVAATLAAVEAQLRAAGASNFLMVTLPDVGLLPGAAPNAAFDSAASVSANQALQQFIAVEQFVPGVQISVLDMYAFSEEVENNPAQYGFTNITTPCLSTSDQVCDNPDQTFFWDTVHPTRAAHALLATIAEAQL